MLNSRLILAENNEKQTVINQEEKDSDTKISQEDMEIIRELEILENLDMFQGGDIDFLKDYDTVGENINNEENTDE
jgi:hypothetical protein